MSLPRRRLAVLVATVLALGPGAAGALAQSAGDQQYDDPFAQTTSATSSTPSAPTPPPVADPSATTTAAPAAPAAATAATAPAAVPATTELARTGLDVRLVAAAGLLLVALGAGLRLRGAGGRG